MRDEHSADILYVQACRVQGCKHPAHGDSGVDQKVCIPI